MGHWLAETSDMSSRRLGSRLDLREITLCLVFRECLCYSWELLPGTGEDWSSCYSVRIQSGLAKRFLESRGVELIMSM